MSGCPRLSLIYCPMIQTQELIITDLSRRGNGQNETSPIRTVVEIYTKDGQLLASNDSRGNYTVEQMIEFGKICQAKKELSAEEIYLSWKKDLSMRNYCLPIA
jgi:hypothetical protein